MLGALLSALGVLVAAAVVFVIGLAVVRRWRGEAGQGLYIAIGLFLLALSLDFVVLYFSVSFCTASLKDALRLRGSGTANPLLDDLMRTFGGRGLDIGTLWGVIIPAVSWVSAHGVALAAFWLMRSGYGLIRAHATPSEGDARPAPDLGRIWAYLAGSSLGLVLAIVVFNAVVSFDSLLIRYQIISSSRVLKAQLGDNWEARLGQEELLQKLGSSFLGQIVLHAGTFYVVTLLVSAAVMVAALHNLVFQVGRIRRPLPLPVAPPTPPPPPPGLPGVRRDADQDGLPPPPFPASGTPRHGDQPARTTEAEARSPVPLEAPANETGAPPESDGPDAGDGLERPPITLSE